MKKFVILFCLFYSLNAIAQREPRQDIGLNLAGVFIKNQATVAPALFYRYSFNNWQLRFQLSLDGNLVSKNRNGKSNNGGGFGNFEQDSAIDYEPGKDMRYGLMVGIQKNIPVKNTPFSCYYGLDLIYMMNDFSQTGSGTVVFKNGGFDQNARIKLKNTNTLKTYGFGMPVGITYKFGKKFYTSLEAKFVVAYQKGENYNFSESILEQSGVEQVTINEGTTNDEGFDLGIKPITGLCIGYIF